MTDNQVIVITGASQGLGAGMVARFASQGYRIGACSRNIDSADQTRVIARKVDVTDPSAVEAFSQAVIEAFGAIDLWINNAGLLEPVGPMASIDNDAFRRLLDVNIMGVVHGSQSFVRHRQQLGGGGVLINISSGAALRGIAGWSAYCASKGALDRISEALSQEVAAQGTRVYAVAPGVIDTNMQSMIRASSEQDFPSRQRFVDLKTNNHFNTPEFVADELLVLAFGEDPTNKTVLRLDNEWER